MTKRSEVVGVKAPEPATRWFRLTASRKGMPWEGFEFAVAADATEEEISQAAWAVVAELASFGWEEIEGRS